MPSEVRPTVSAVVPHWNRRDLLPELFDSIHKQHQKFDEVIIIDNGSTDGSPALAESLGARVLRMERNLGFAAAVNRGIDAASSDWIAILNNDVTLDPAWLSTLVTRGAKAGAAFATGKILNASNPSLIDGTYDEISRGACAYRCGAGKPDGPYWTQERAIRIAPMTAALFRRDLFTEIDGLDETFGSYLEDVDFGIRCATAGHHGLYVPTAIAYHRGSSTLGRWSHDTVWHIARNQVLLAVKHFQGQPNLPLLAGQLLWGLLAVKHGCGVAFLAGRRAGKRMRAKDRAFSPVAAGRLRDFLAESERQILAVQRTTGFDGYWRAYFWLAR